MRTNNCDQLISSGEFGGTLFSDKPHMGKWLLPGQNSHGFDTWKLQYGGKTIQYGFKTRFSDESGILDLWPNPKGWHHGFGQCIPDTLNLVIIMSDIILASKAGYDPFIRTKLGANLKTQQNHPKEKDEQWATCLTYKKSPKYVAFLCQCVPFLCQCVPFHARVRWDLCCRRGCCRKYVCIILYMYIADYSGKMSVEQEKHTHRRWNSWCQQKE